MVLYQSPVILLISMVICGRGASSNMQVLQNVKWASAAVVTWSLQVVGHQLSQCCKWTFTMNYFLICNYYKIGRLITSYAVSLAG